MPYTIENFYRSTCLVTEIEEVEQSLRLWGDRTHLWFEPHFDHWQGVETLLNKLVQASVGEPPAGSEDNCEVACDNEKVEAIIQQIIANPHPIEAVWLTPITVSQGDRQRWITRMGWNEDSEQGDGPLHFYYCSTSPNCPGVVIPIEAIDDWLSQWSFAFFYWQADQRKLSPWLQNAQAAIQQVATLQPKQTLQELEAWAQQIDRLDPTQAATHMEWNQFHIALAPHGLFEPEDDGALVHSLVEQGYSTLAQYREATLALDAHAQILPGIFLPNCAHPLAATISLHWFRLGPFHSDRMDMLRYLKFGLKSFLNTAPRQQSGFFVVSQGGIGGHFSYAKGLAHTSQLYRGCEAIDPTAFDGYRLSEVSARLSRAGHTTVARAVAAIATLHEPEQFQHWVELGMTLWYDDRKTEGMACLQRAAELDEGFALSSFLKAMRAKSPAPLPLPSNPSEYYLNEVLPAALQAWLVLPRQFQFALVWLRSLLTEPCLNQHWFFLMEALGDVYLSREILRGLTPAARAVYLSQLPPQRRSRLQSHVQLYRLKK